jgi:peptidoglycan pentaglycine glycine transferase (the second and third glycine)
MYIFGTAVDFEQFNSFAEANGGTFMQTTMWSAIKKATWSARFYEGVDENKTRCLTCLILQRTLPAAGRIWYAPSGFVADYENERLISEFTAFLKTEMKKNAVTALIIDPQTVESISGVFQPSSKTTTDILKKCGYVFNSDRDDYIYQPSMTVALKLTDENGAQLSEPALLKKFDKGIRYSVRIGYQRGLKAFRYTCDDLKADMKLYDDFLSVMNDTSERVGFVTRPYNYYMEFIEQFAKWADIDLIYYDKKSDAENNEKNAASLADIDEKLENEQKQAVVNRLKGEKDSLEAQIKAYSERFEETKDIEKELLPVACGVTISFGSLASCLFGGTRNIIRNNVRSSHLLNYIRIQRSLENGYALHDMGRVPHEYMNESSKHNGLFKFKMSFAADVYEYIGEYALIGNAFKYNLYKKLIPTAKRVRVKIVYRIKKIIRR